MEAAVLWTEVGANVATIAAGVVALVTIPLAYHQIRMGERSRRLDLVEGRIVDAFLQLPTEPTRIFSFSGAEYRELLRDLQVRHGLARLLRNWRTLAGNEAKDPLLSEIWRKLAFDLIAIENDSQAVLARENVDLTSFEGQELDAIRVQSEDGAGGFTNLSTVIEGGREIGLLCDKLRRALRSFDAEGLDVMLRTLSSKELSR